MLEKRIIASRVVIIMFFMLILNTPFIVRAEEINIDNDIFTYSVEGEGVTITGLKDVSVTALDIPNEMEGLPVTGIKGSAFKDNMELTSVKLPSSLGRRRFTDARNWEA